MPFRFIEDIATADVAFEATGSTMEEAFASAAEATLQVMVDEPWRVEGRERMEVRLANSALDMLLYDFLNELIYLKDAQRLLLKVESLLISKAEDGYGLTGVLTGEALDPGRHPLSADVKAVTLYRLSMEERDGVWKATAVLDI